MICSAYSAANMSNAALIFYTCIWIPFLQMKWAVVSIVGFMFYPFQQQPAESSATAHQNGCCCLPAARFEDLEKNYCSNGGEEVVCSICLVDFEWEDVVSQLPKCGHLFHTECIERWLDRNHFSCPLCRSLFLHSAAFSCKMS